MLILDSRKKQSEVYDAAKGKASRVISSSIKSHSKLYICSTISSLMRAGKGLLQHAPSGTQILSVYRYTCNAFLLKLRSSQYDQSKSIYTKTVIRPTNKNLETLFDQYGKVPNSSNIFNDNKKLSRVVLDRRIKESTK